MLLRATAVWFVLLIAAILNGAVREGFIIPRAGAYVGHVVSTISLSVLILATATASIDWIAPGGQIVSLGLYWLTLTLAFEFLAGHYLFGNPWARLLEDYNVAQGRIWILVLVVTMFAPAIGARLRSLV